MHTCTSNNNIVVHKCLISSYSIHSLKLSNYIFLLSFLTRRRQWSVAPTLSMAAQHSSIPGTTKVWGLRFDLMKPCLSWTTARALPCRVRGLAISQVNGQMKGTVCWDTTTQASDVAEKGDATTRNDGRNVF